MSDSSKPRHRDVRRSGQSTVNVGMEYREVDASSVSMKATGKDVVTITGQPIVYSTPYTVRDSMGEFQETMIPGCVTDVLAKGVDCRLLINHSGMPLARTTSHTLRLKDTPTALTMSADIDVRSQQGNDLLVAIERGDVSQMSVGMIVGREQLEQQPAVEVDLLAERLGRRQPGHVPVQSDDERRGTACSWCQCAVLPVDARRQGAATADGSRR